MSAGPATATAVEDAIGSSPRPRAVVIAPLFYLTITIENHDEAERVHLHPGGQGFWIARMLEALGCDAILAAPVGGETGAVLRALLPSWGIELAAVDMDAASPAYVHDRSSGERIEIVAPAPPALDRHEIDDLYGVILSEALASDGCVMTSAGPGLLPDELYTRLVHDASANDVAIFADMHGSSLPAAMRGGTLTALKVSDEDLRCDGWDVGSSEQAVEAALQLAASGIDAVVISRGSEPALAVIGERVVHVRPPELLEVDHRGAGDSMTGGIAAGFLLGLGPEGAVRLGAAAGAGNVTRRGLGSGSPDLIAALTELVSIEDVR